MKIRPREGFSGLGGTRPYTLPVTHDTEPQRVGGSRENPPTPPSKCWHPAHHRHQTEGGSGLQKARTPSPICPGCLLNRLSREQPGPGESRSPGWARPRPGPCCPGRHFGPTGEAVPSCPGPGSVTGLLRVGWGHRGRQGTGQPWTGSAVHRGDRQKNIQLSGEDRRGPCRHLGKMSWVLGSEKA